MRNALEWKTYYSGREFLDNYIYEGNDLGTECTENGTVFRLWSPQADSVCLNLYKDGSIGEAFQIIPMKKEEKGVWSWETKEELHGIYYDFTITREGEQISSPDPYARACGVNGIRSMAVNLRRTDPEGWENDHAPEEKSERIIYELHVKEFSWDVSGGFPEAYRGKYKAFTCAHTTLNQDGIHPTGLDWLKELGVTHIQLMPVFDYSSVDEAGDEAAFNWGYDPANYNVPEGSYATDAEHGEVRIRELKEMIRAIHQAGFGVIMDVVYNHTHSFDSPFQKTAPWYFYRMFEDGTISNGSCCGNDMASERTMCAKYIQESVLYWAEEYHIDGFRFDLMGLLDVDLMNRIRKELDIRYGKGVKIMYGEPWAADRTAVEGNAVCALKENVGLLDENIGIFSDDTRDAVKGSALEAKEPGFINGAGAKEDAILAGVTAWCSNPFHAKGAEHVKAPSQIITYVSAHDNHTLWDKLDETVEKKERMRLNKMAAGIYMTCQGNLFLLSGEEFARTKEGNDNSYNASVELNRIDWNLAWENRELAEYYKGLIALRKQMAGLCDKTKDSKERISGLWKEKGVVGFTVENGKESEWKKVKVIYNSTKKAFPFKAGEEEWTVLCDADSSSCWKQEKPAGAQINVQPQSVLILGQQ